jgi:DNA-binding XRE family transcriptional regulator
MADDDRGANLREWRNRRGLSQDELAHQADVTKTTIQGLENGRTRGTGSTWRRLAKVLGTDVETLHGTHRAAG